MTTSSNPYCTRDFYSMAAFFADIDESPIADRDAGVPVTGAAQSKRVAALGRAGGEMRIATTNESFEEIAHPRVKRTVV